MHDYKKLNVWSESIKIASIIYEITMRFPKEEQFGLTSQMRRCAVSIASNIAEGSGRNNPNEFNHFLGYAIGSSFELETQLILANGLGFCNETDFNNLMEKLIVCQKMLFKLQQSLKINK